MQTTIKFPDGKSYNTSDAIIGRGTLKGHSRETLTIKAAMTYAEAAAHFVDGAVFTLTDEFGDSYEWRDHGVAGAITDNRDGTITAIMGKNNTAEQDAQDEAAKAREAAETLAWLTFNIPYHGTTPETALPYVPGQPAHAIYHVGEYMIFTDGYTYKCKQDTTYSPSEYAGAWEKVST